MKVTIYKDNCDPTDTFYCMVAEEVVKAVTRYKNYAGVISRRVKIKEGFIDIWVVSVTLNDGSVYIVNFGASLFDKLEMYLQAFNVNIQRLEKEVNKRLHEKEVSRN